MIAAPERICWTFVALRKCGLSIVVTPTTSTSASTMPSSRKRSSISATRCELCAGWTTFWSSASVVTLRPRPCPVAARMIACSSASARVNSRATLPSKQHDDAVGHAEHLRQLGRDHQHGDAAPGELGEQAVHLGLRADVDAARRLVDDEQRRVAREPLRQHDLLLVAARERPGRVRQLAVLQLQPESPSPRRIAARLRAGSSLPAANAVERGERDVALDREVHHQALLAAVLGDERDAGGHRRRRRSRRQRLARRSRPTRRPSGRSRRSRARPPSGRRRRARRARRSRPLRTSKETSVKTPSRVSRSTFSTTGARLGREPSGTARPCRGRPSPGSPTASSAPRPASVRTWRPSRITVTRWQSAKISSSRWETKSTASPCARRVSTMPNSRSTSVLVSAAVGSSITITPRVRRQRLRDLDELLVGDREAARQPVGVEPDAELLEDGGRLAAHPPAVDAAEPLERLHADEDVLGDGQVGEERRLLEDDRDPGGLRLLGVVEDRLLAVEQSRPASGRWTPARILTSVDLPAPFSPTRPCTSPAKSSMSPSSRA